MNKKIYLFLISLLLAFSARVEATHLFGGEITWTCLGSGQYQFTLKVYRDCNGSPLFLPGDVDSLHVWGHPTLRAIAFNQTLNQITDISPSHCVPNCVSGGAGTVQEFVFKTNPITIAGTPPASGWIFTWDFCCRPVGIVNGPFSGAGYTSRAIMYPYAGANTNPCFDNSPFFIERPNLFICTGYPYTYNPTASDPDRDSLVYSWATCLAQPTNTPPQAFNAPVISHSLPYSLNSQLPGNPTLNSETGELTFNSIGVTGKFATCIQVTAYKCGIKVAEIFRDVGIELISGCIVQGGANNLPPTLTKPFAQGTAYDTTVYVGDTVRFFLQASDLQGTFGTGAPQLITLTASGEQFGIPNNTDGGCGNPPCAKLSKLLPFSSPIANQVGFEWRTACNHVVPPVGCIGVNDTYYFVIKASDSQCPAPGVSTATIKIRVKIPPKLKQPGVRGASILNATGDVGLYWETPLGKAVLDTHSVFHSYEIYAATTNAGPYTLIDSVTGSKNFYKQKGDTLTAAQLAMIGANALNNPVYFYVKTRSVTLSIKV